MPIQAIQPSQQPAIARPITLQCVEAIIDFNANLRKRRKVERASVPAADFIEAAVLEKQV
jgi:hypothetical protein